MYLSLKQTIAVLALGLSSIVSALQISGELQQGGLVLGRVDADSEVYYQGKAIQTSADGQFIIGLDRDAKDNIRLEVHRNGEVNSHEFAVARRDYNIQTWIWILLWIQSLKRVISYYKIAPKHKLLASCPLDL